MLKEKKEEMEMMREEKMSEVRAGTTSKTRGLFWRRFSEKRLECQRAGARGLGGLLL